MGENLPVPALGAAVSVCRALASLVILVTAQTIGRDNESTSGSPLVTLSKVRLTTAVTVSGC